MKSIILSLVMISQVVLAEPPPDAPVMKLQKGQFAPYDGVLLTGDKSVETAKRIVSCETERNELKAGHVSTTMIVLLVVAGALVGGGVGYGAAKLVK